MQCPDVKANGGRRSRSIRLVQVNETNLRRLSADIKSGHTEMNYNRDNNCETFRRGGSKALSSWKEEELRGSRSRLNLRIRMRCGGGCGHAGLVKATKWMASDEPEAPSARLQRMGNVLNPMKSRWTPPGGMATLEQEQSHFTWREKSTMRKQPSTTKTVVNRLWCSKRGGGIPLCGRAIKAGQE